MVVEFGRNGVSIGDPGVCCICFRCCLLYLQFAWRQVPFCSDRPTLAYDTPRVLH